MPATLTRKAEETPEFVDVEVDDLTGQQSVTLTGLKPETPLRDVIGMSTAGLSVLPDVEYLLRDRETSRLLRSDQTLGDVTREPRATLTLQPDARLG